jgi:hypothetical protein
MQYHATSYSFRLLNAVTTAMLLMALGSQCPALAEESLTHSSAARCQDGLPAGMGRLYVFREVRSYGAHIDDYVTVDGRPVHRITPGTGLYCDLRPGNYLIGVARHKANLLTLPIARRQCQYICIMLHTQAGVAPRSGGLTSDQSFDVRLLQPGYGAQRVREYHMTEGKCQP